jgi:protein involved in polysaccharide export with SLBB domain
MKTAPLVRMMLLVSALMIFASQTVWSQETPSAAAPAKQGETAPATGAESSKGDEKQETPADQGGITPKTAEAKVMIHDILAVEVKEDAANLNGYYRVAPNGTFILKYAGAIPVEGLTAAEVAAKIKSVLEADYLKKATVTVEVNTVMPAAGAAGGPPPVAQNLGTIWVMGQVNNKGQMAIPPNEEFTVSKALLRAGISNFAKISRTKLVRMENGRSKEIIVNVYDVIHRGKRELDVPVQKDDWIIVPQGMFPDPS